MTTKPTLDAFRETLLPRCTIDACAMSRCPVPGDGRCPLHFNLNTCPCCWGNGEHVLGCATLPPKMTSQQRAQHSIDLGTMATIEFLDGDDGSWHCDWPQEFGEDSDDAETDDCIWEQLIAKVRGLA